MTNEEAIEQLGYVDGNQLVNDEYLYVGIDLAIKALNKQKKNPVVEINDDFGSILNCAVRYALGRQTYMPKLVVDYITPLLKHLDNRTLGVMWRDLSAEDTYFGSETIDKPIWLEFLSKIEKEMKDRKNDL